MRPAHRARAGAHRPGRGARAAGRALRAPPRSRSAPPSACCASSSTASRRRPCSTTRSRRSAASCPERRRAPPVIKLYQFPPVFGRNVSPFSLKLETWLKLAGLPYQVVAIRNPGQGPKGKLPFIEDDDGSFIADSSLIIEHLSRSRGIDLDAGLDARQRAEALALQRLVEEHLYFVLVWSRWLDPEGWPTLAPALLGSIPPPLRQLAAIALRRRIRNASTPRASAGTAATRSTPWARPISPRSPACSASSRSSRPRGRPRSMPPPTGARQHPPGPGRERAQAQRRELRQPRRLDRRDGAPPRRLTARRPRAASRAELSSDPAGRREPCLPRRVGPASRA